jgi:hypothetical protein
MIDRNRLLGAAAVAALLTLSTTASAQATNEEDPLLVALVGNRAFLTIDAATPKVLKRTIISGINKRVLAFDVRPADGMLYAVTEDGTVVTVNVDDGSTIFVSQLPQVPPKGVRVSADFNPVPNLLRMIGSDGTNLRANVDLGTVTQDTAINFILPNPFGGTTPSVIAAAYSNAVAGATGTLLWDIEDTTNALYVQVPPNMGVLNPVAGQLGISPTDIGFDIETLPSGVSRGWVINGDLLHRVNLVGGLAREGVRVQGLREPVRDLAVLPR